ncbi:MAG: efflux RND transporter periplasmic adaptor subunit [bacterium]|nr:efflux RND transporter periplasmic adaptor subunit [bacterium]
MTRFITYSGSLLVSALLMLSLLACGGTSMPAPVESARDHDEEAEHEEEGRIHLEDDQLDALGIEIDVAGEGKIGLEVELPGEVQVNGDRMAHVVPRVKGIVREVFFRLGDSVKAGDTMAVLDSGELAEWKADFLAAGERAVLAESTFEREERLWRQKVSPEKDFLDARRELAEAKIRLRTAKQKLMALGFSQVEIEALPQETGNGLTRYRVAAPFDGTVIEKHLTLGETVAADQIAFSVADLRTVWLDLQVYQKDLGAVHAGQEATVTTSHGDRAQFKIDFVQPLVGEPARTALARIIAPNPDGEWHPGCFVTARVATEQTNVRVVVPTSAVFRMEDGDNVVFVVDGHEFELRIVELGRSSGNRVEIRTGLEVGERYVFAGGFALKAELGKHAFGDGHAH